MKKALTITRKDFNDTDKAKIFVRDRATCSFSGANLWLLDSPLRVGWQSDWADHKKPISRGGKADWEKNGVCASHTLNMKKRNNSADTTYFFNEGHPTALYYELLGPPSASDMMRLKRLARLEISDWYLNRSITWIFEALNYKWAKPDYKRTDERWFKAAYAKLVVFQHIQCECKSLEEKGIIANPSETQKILLSIRDCDSLRTMTKAALQLSTQYSRNSQAWWEYFHPEEYVESSADLDSQRKKAYQKACKLEDRLDTETFDCIQTDYQIRFSSN
jgi:hypothetical protein